MLTYAGLGLVAFSIMMILPVSADKPELQFYGLAALVVYDINGNEVFSQ